MILSGSMPLRAIARRLLRNAISPVVVCLCIFVSTMASAASAAQNHVIGRQPTELDRLVDDVCDQSVVLLGEDSHHGSGGTMETKVAIVKRLVDECGFSAVLFESQIYDCFDFERSIRAGHATPAKLANAIGGLWVPTQEVDPLVSYLYRKAIAGKVRLAGLDPQVLGAMKVYTPRRLSGELAEYLQGDRRNDCEARLSRLTNWRADDTAAGDAALRPGQRACIGDIQAALGQQPASDSRAIAESMAANLTHYLDMSADHAHVSAIRDAAMFENFKWHLAHLPAGTKAIVWSATVHAAKQEATGITDTQHMGADIHRLMGDRAAAIGFSALSGSYARPGRSPTRIEPAKPGSLEARAFTGFPGDLRYLDRQQLTDFGVVSGRAVTFGNPTATDWSKVLDGIVVLRRERPPRSVQSSR